ncbi:BCD family MFS transporter [Leptolyngbya sp. FACHB-36]|nr:BCD family MFS transporter [Leptolyngbya sp. FACHB-36]
MGLSMMSILTLGVLNRVMIQELAIPATIVAGLVAIPLFVSPARIWFGQLSDAKRLFGGYRTGYIWMGAAVLAIAAFLAVQAMWQLGSAVQTAGGWTWAPHTIGWLGLLAFVFVVYGLAISASSTAFMALLVDISEADNRSKLVGIVWSMLMVGVIVGAVLSGSLLGQLSTDSTIETLQASVNRLFTVIPAIVVGLALVATVGIERTFSKYSSRSTVVDREDGITLGRAWRILTVNPQTARFFTFLVVMTISLFMIDPVMEPYGGQVFGMPVSESTRLNAFVGIGTLISLSATGFFLVPRLGKRRTAKLGCLLIALAVGLIGLSGFTANPRLLQASLFLFGLANGIITTGTISLMLDLTAAETAGTFMGAWGLGQSTARGIAVVTGGASLDVGKSLFTNPVLAYGLVFALQAVAMVFAIWVLNRVNVKEARTNPKQAIASVLETELD